MAPGDRRNARRRSRQPSRDRRIHLNTRFALTSCARAGPATEAPGARAASTIRRRSAVLHERRFARGPASTGKIQTLSILWPSSSGVPQIAGGHLDTNRFRSAAITSRLPTAEALPAICDLDLTELQSIVPPRGFGRD